jgi:hypothetical protein
VQPLTPAERAYAIVTAAARDLNDELTIIVNSAAGTLEVLEPAHPAVPLVRELQGAAQRCIWKTSGLLNYGVRNGAKPSPAAMERIIREPEGDR